ncbi:MAG: hypothetical protein IJS90_02815 [Clostridia bacterium]|nr:hypothetical protein [Clostridia bacterium]
MKEIYNLDTAVPVPHDCVIKKINVSQGFIEFIFEDDISYHDSIKAIRPDAKSLVVRYHLIEADGFEVYKWKRNRLLKNKGCFKRISGEELIKLTQGGLEYLYHNVGFNSVITKLFSNGYIIVDAEADYIEFEWK